MQLTILAGINKILMNHLTTFKHRDLGKSEQRQGAQKTEIELQNECL